MLPSVRFVSLHPSPHVSSFLSEKRVLSQVNRNRYQHHRRFYQYQQPAKILLPERRCNKEEGRGGRERVRVCVRSRMDEGAFFGSTRSNVDFYRVFTAHRRITCPTCAKNIAIRERRVSYLPGRKHFLTRNPDCPFISAIFLDGYLLFLSLFLFFFFSLKVIGDDRNRIVITCIE